MSGDEHPERVNHPEDELYFLAGEGSGESPPREVDEEKIRPPRLSRPRCSRSPRTVRPEEALERPKLTSRVRLLLLDAWARSPRISSNLRNATRKTRRHLSVRRRPPRSRCSRYSAKRARRNSSRHWEEVRSLLDGTARRPVSSSRFSAAKRPASIGSAKVFSFTRPSSVHRTRAFFDFLLRLEPAIFRRTVFSVTQTDRSVRRWLSSVLLMRPPICCGFCCGSAYLPAVTPHPGGAASASGFRGRSWSGRSDSNRRHSAWEADGRHLKH